MLFLAQPGFGLGHAQASQGRREVVQLRYHLADSRAKFTAPRFNVAGEDIFLPQNGKLIFELLLLEQDLPGLELRLGKTIIVRCRIAQGNADAD